MKTKLTKEESQRLIELGVPKEKASGKYITPQGKPIVCAGGVLNETAEQYPVFKLEDFLNGEILPKELREGCLYLTIYGNVVGYAFDVEYEGLFWAASFGNAELIDSFYELTNWYYGEYLKYNNNGK